MAIHRDGLATIQKSKGLLERATVMAPEEDGHFSELRLDTE